VTDGDLHIIDVQNPGSPIVVGFVDVPGYAGDVKVVDDYAYIAASNYCTFTI